jgi:spore maturation protein CgeB
MRQILPHLKDYKVVIGGTGWEFLPDTSNQLIKQDAIVGEEYYLYTQGAKIVLNLHRESDELTMSNNEHVQASSPNNRFFEVNMMGAFQMVDELRMPEIKDYYPDTVSFKDPTEFLTKFNHWMSDENGRKQIAQRNRDHTMKFHRFENRFSEIIAKLI